RLADHGRLRARAADPAVDGTVARHESPIATTCGRRPAHVDDGRERERLSRRGELARADEHIDGAHSASPTSFSAAQTLSEVTGISRFRTPAWARASTTAFTKAAGEPTVADSPTPFAPIGWCGEGVTVSPSSKRGVSQAVGMR